MSGSSGSSLTSTNAELILLVNDNDTKSYVVTSEGSPIFFIDSNVNIGINTIKPGAQLGILTNDGTTGMRLTRDATTQVDIDITTNGVLSFTPSGPKTMLPSANVRSRLVLGGEVVTTSATKLNSNDTTPGVAVAGKIVILDEYKNFSGVNQFSAVSIQGTIQDADQSAITNLGFLESLTVMEALTTSSLMGTVVTQDQTTITSVGTLTALNVSGQISCFNVSGTIQTAAQPNITSLGDLSSITVGGKSVDREWRLLEGVTAGEVSGSCAISVDANKSVTGITTLRGQNLTGVLQTASQPNIKRVGNLNELSVSGAASGALLFGTLLTASHPSITTLGRMASVTVAGSSITTEFRRLAGSIPGLAGSGKVLTANATKDISGLTRLDATSIEGIVQTSTQSNVRSLGALTALSVAGASIGIEAGYLSGATPGVAAASKAMILDGSRSISGVSSIVTSTFSGIIKTSDQPNITSLGTLSALHVRGGTVQVLSIAESTSTTTGAMRIGGGAGVTKNVVVGTGIYGTLTLPKQHYVTQVGPLTSLTIAGDLHLRSGTITINGTPVTPTPVGSETTTTPTYVLGSTLGQGISGKILTLDANNDLSGVPTLSASNITGTIQTGAQANISRLGMLETLNVAGSISAEKLSTTMDTAVQPVVSSLGRLTGLTISGSASAAGESNATSVVDGGDFSVAGGMAVAENTFIGGDVVSSGLVLNGVTITGLEDEENDNSNSPFVTEVALGTATANSCLALGDVSDIEGIGNVDVSTITTSGTLKYDVNDKWDVPSTAIDAVLNKFTIADSIQTIVVVGRASYEGGGCMFVSNDAGKTWTQVATVDDNAEWTGVCWSEYIGKFVAVAKSGTTRSMYSSTGYTWTSANIRSDGLWRDVIWSNPLKKFAAVCENGPSIVAYSNDGINWINWGASHVAEPNYTPAAIAGGSNGLVAVSEAGSPYTHTFKFNGSTTTAPSIRNPGNNSYAWKSVAYSFTSKCYAAVSSNRGPDNITYSFNEGLTWASATIDLNYNGEYTSWSSITWDEDRDIFIAVGESAMGTSSDGINWSQSSFYPELTNLTLIDEKYFPSKDRLLAIAHDINGNNFMISSSKEINSKIDWISYDGIPDQAASLYQGMSSDASTLISEGPVRWLVDGKEKLRVDGDGRVGICSTNPEFKLEVNSGENSAIINLQTPSASRSLPWLCKFETSDFETIDIDNSQVVVENTDSAALTVNGGMEVGNQLYQHEPDASIDIGGIVTTESTLTTTGGISVDGVVFTSGNAQQNTLQISNNDESMSTSTGSLTTLGGVGIAGTLYSGGSLTVESLDESTSNTTGAITTAGGVGCGGSVFVEEELTLSRSDNSTSTTTGSIVASGGLGVPKNLNVGDSFSIEDETESSAVNEGALAVNGGVGVGEDVRVGGSVVTYDVSEASVIGGDLSASAITVGAISGVTDATVTNVSVDTDFTMNGTDINIVGGTGGSVTIADSVSSLPDQFVGISPITNLIKGWESDELIISRAAFDSVTRYRMDGSVIGQIPILMDLPSVDEIAFNTMQINIDGTISVQVYKTGQKGVWLLRGTKDGFSEITFPASSSGRLPSFVYDYNGNGLALGAVVFDGYSRLYMTDNSSQNGVYSIVSFISSLFYPYEIVWHEPTQRFCAAYVYSGYAQIWVSNQNPTAANFSWQYKVYRVFIQDFSVDSTTLKLYTNYESGLMLVTLRSYNTLVYTGWYSMDGITWVQLPFPIRSAVSVGPSMITFDYSTSPTIGKITVDSDTNEVVAVSTVVTNPNSLPLYLSKAIMDDGTLLMLTQTYTSLSVDVSTSIFKPGFYGIQTGDGFVSGMAASGSKFKQKIDDTNSLDLLQITSAGVSVGNHSITDSTASDASTTGALVVSGGMGIGGDLSVTGGGVFGGTMTHASDARLKQNITPIDLDVVRKLYEIDAVTFDWNHEENDSNEVGVIAQDLAARDLTHLLCQIDNNDLREGLVPKLEPEGKQWCVDYAGMAMYNMRMLQELIAEDNDFHARVSVLESTRSGVPISG